MVLYKRYAKALYGKSHFCKYGKMDHIDGAYIITYDTIQNGCKIISPTLFESVRSIINDEFMNQVEAKGKELKLSDEKYLLHKLEAATLAVETAREYFNIQDLKSKRAKNMSAEEIAALEKEASYSPRMKTLISFSKTLKEREEEEKQATPERLVALEQQLLAEFRTALAQKLAPFMATAS